MAASPGVPPDTVYPVRFSGYSTQWSDGGGATTTVGYAFIMVTDEYPPFRLRP